MSKLVLDLPLVFHQSIVDQFPESFREFRLRKLEDRCIVLEFPSSNPAEFKYLVVCLLQLSIVKSASAR